MPTIRKPGRWTVRRRWADVEDTRSVRLLTCGALLVPCCEWHGTFCLRSFGAESNHSWASIVAKRKTIWRSERTLLPGFCRLSGRTGRIRGDGTTDLTRKGCPDEAVESRDSSGTSIAGQSSAALNLWDDNKAPPIHPRPVTRRDGSLASKLCVQQVNAMSRTTQRQRLLFASCATAFVPIQLHFILRTVAHR